MPTIVGFEEPRVVKRRNISETARNSDLVSSVGAGSTSMRANFTLAEPYFHSTFDFQMIALCGAKELGILGDAAGVWNFLIASREASWNFPRQDHDFNEGISWLPGYGIRNF